MKKLWPLALLAVVLVAADKPAADKKSDKDRFQGAWVVTGVEAKGEAVKDGETFNQLKDMKLTFKDDAVINSKHPKDEATFKIDADKKPATIDVNIKGREGDSMRMLYEFKDDTTLRLCGSKKETERPKEFGSKEDQLVITLKREDNKPN